MTEHNSSQITKYTRHFFSGTLLSRISGMVRDMSMAALFGDHPSVAAFMVAFRFSHVLRRLLGEGTLQSIFIPHYEELKLQDPQKASGFFFRVNILVLTLLIGMILLVETAAGFKLFYSSPGENEVLRLFALLFPGLIFISLYGLNLSLLQCKNAFFSSSVAPSACNVIWICAVFLFAHQEAPKAMLGLALFTVVGFVIQWLITLPKAWDTLKEGRHTVERPLFSLPKEMRTIGKATFLGLIGITAVQINSFLDMLFARSADIKGPIYLWYAIRLEQLPLAVVGFACVYSIIPSLTRLIKSGDREKAQELFVFGYKRIFQLVIPCSFALFALGFVSVNLLFGRGSFSSYATLETTFCLWAYGIGLLPSILTIYQSSLCYAFGDFKTPTLASVIAVGVNTLLNALFVFVFHWGALSIALSTSLSACLNYLILKRAFLKKDHWKIAYPSISPFWKLGIIGLSGFVGCLLFDQIYLGGFFFENGATAAPRTVIHQLLYFTGQLMTFGAVSVLGLLLIDRESLSTIKKLLLPERKGLFVSKTPEKNI